MPSLSNRKRAASILAVTLCMVLSAHAQQTDELQDQLRQLEQQYERTTRELRERITALEQQIQKRADTTQIESQKERTVSAAELAAEAARKAALGESSQDGQTLQGKLPSAPTYDLLRDAESKIEKLEEQVKSFEFHGYFRAGYGLNSRGGQQVPFQAPGADAKFRLGNEAETYGELIFINNWLNPEHDSDKAWMKAQFMVEANTSNSASYANFTGGIGNDQFRLREAFIQAGNVFKSQPDAKFWAGERYYRRYQAHLDDFYILDMSGYGGGIEDLNARIGKMSLAYLAGARPDIFTPNGNYAKSNIDVRLYDVKAPGGKFGGWFNFATAKGGTTQTGTVLPDTNGYAFGVGHQRLEWHGGYNWISFQYGKGAASNFSTSIDDPTTFVKSTERLRIVEHLLLILSAAPLAIEQLHQLSPEALQAYRVDTAASVKMPYIIISIALVLLAVAIAMVKLPKIEHAESSPGQKISDSIWKHPNLLFGALGIFAYVGAEVSIGSFLVNYLGQSDIAGFSAQVAAGYVSFYWGGAMVGRFIGAAVLQRIKTGRLLAVCSICTATLVTVSMLASGHPAMWSMLAVGFFNSIMFPSIFTLGIAGLGPLTGNGSGLMNMAIVGGAIIPLIQGAIADRVGIHHAFFLPVVCYLYILFYALRGSMPNSERRPVNA